MAATIIESGVITIDGKMRLPQERLREFCAANKGRRVVARFEAYQPATSAAVMAYYYNYVVPTVQEALLKTGKRMSEARTDEYLIQEYPGDLVGRDGKEVEQARDIKFQRQMLEFLEWLKEFAAEYLSVYVEDPKSI